jgi:hypothetical protein
MKNECNGFAMARCKAHTFQPNAQASSRLPSMSERIDHAMLVALTQQTSKTAFAIPVRTTQCSQSAGRETAVCHKF